MSAAADKMLSNVSAALGFSLFTFSLTINGLSNLPTTSSKHKQVVVTVTKPLYKSVSTRAADVDPDRRTAATHGAFRFPVACTQKRRAPGQYRHQVVTLNVRAGHPRGEVIDTLTLNLAKYAARPHRDVRALGAMEHGTHVDIAIKCADTVSARARGNARGPLRMLRRSADRERAGPAAADAPTAPSQDLSSTTAVAMTESTDASLPADHLRGSQPDQLATQSVDQAAPSAAAATAAETAAAAAAAVGTDGRSTARQCNTAPSDADHRRVSQAAEIDRLRAQVSQLQADLRREPTYRDVIRELKDCKFALAQVTLENKEMEKQLSRARAVMGKLLDSDVHDLRRYDDVVDELVEVKGKFAALRATAE